MKKSNNYRYKQFSSLGEISAEKDRLRKKARRQEEELSADWSRIEKDWHIVAKITDMAGNLFSSVSTYGSINLGYRLLSNLFSKKKKRKSAKAE